MITYNYYDVYNLLYTSYLLLSLILRTMEVFVLFCAVITILHRMLISFFYMAVCVSLKTFLIILTSYNVFSCYSSNMQNVCCKALCLN